jgi:myosin heavy subunit
MEAENQNFRAKQKEILKQQEEFKRMMSLLQEEKEKLIHQLNETLQEKLVLKQTKEKLEKSIREELKNKATRSELLEKLQRDLEMARSVKEELEKSLEKNLHEIKEREDVLNHLKGELASLDQQLKDLRQESESAHLTIASLKEVLQAKQQKRLVLNSMEPLIDKPLQIEGPVSRDSFNRIFHELLVKMGKNMQSFDVPVAFLEKERTARLESKVYEEASRIWREIEDAHLYVDKPSKGVLVYPISVHNIMSGEKLEEVKFIVLENKLLILKGKEIARAILDANLSAESVMAQLFEIDDQLKKQMFAQGVLGNRFRPRTPRQIMQFALIVNSVMSEKSKTYLSIVADDDIYSSGNFAFRYDLHEAKKPAAEDAVNTPQAAEEQGDPGTRILQRLRKFHERYNTPISAGTK